MFNKVVIIGVGLLGGSLARDLKARGLAGSVVGVCRSRATAEFALAEGLLDAVLDLREAVRDADLVVLATPMQSMLPLLEEMTPYLNPSTTLTDVGSVKQALYEQLAENLPELLSRFVLAHPIAGGEDAGITASREGLFVGKHVIVTPSDAVDAARVESVTAMWRSLGAEVREMSLTEHDAIFARTSHLPHVVAYSLVNYLGAQADSDRLFSLAAAGFYDFTRIASSNAEMWRDICVTNQSEVLAALDGFTAELLKIREKIATADQAGILQAFSAAKAVRDEGLAKKHRASDKTSRGA